MYGHQEVGKRWDELGNSIPDMAMGIIDLHVFKFTPV